MEVSADTGPQPEDWGAHTERGARALYAQCVLALRGHLGAMLNSIWPWVAPSRQASLQWTPQTLPVCAQEELPG